MRVDWGQKPNSKFPVISIYPPNRCFLIVFFLNAGNNISIYPPNRFFLILILIIVFRYTMAVVIHCHLENAGTFGNFCYQRF